MRPRINLFRPTARHRWDAIALAGVEARRLQRSSTRASPALSLAPDVALAVDAVIETAAARRFDRQDGHPLAACIGIARPRRGGSEDADTPR